MLSLDTGATLDRDAIPGAREHGLFVRPIEAFAQLWSRMLELAAQRALCVVVVGGGAAGVELALAMHHRLGERCACQPGHGRRRAAAQPSARGAAPRTDGAQAAQRHRAGRHLRRSHRHARCVLGRGTRVACDAAVIALGAVAPPWLRDSGLALDEQGFVATGPTLQSTSHPEVFAAGDVSTRAGRAAPEERRLCGARRRAAGAEPAPLPRRRAARALAAAARAR